MTYSILAMHETGAHSTDDFSMYKSITSSSQRCQPVGLRVFGIACSCLVLVTLLFCGRAYAQSGRIEIGVKGAPSLATHNGDRAPAENTYKLGGSVGANLRYSLLDWFAVQTELLYATRGSEIELNGNPFNSLAFSYLELPLLVRAGWPGGNAGPPPLSGYAIIGPAVSYLLGATQEGTAISRGDLNSIDISLVAGIGGTWRFMPDWSASLEARYANGFIDAFADLDVGTENRAFLLTLSIDYVLSDRDSDRDGLADYRDRCRTRAADPDQDKDRNGCPDEVEPRIVDKDGDKISDEQDKCDDEPEDYNGYADKDGCPDGQGDADQDGLANADDQCPEEPFSSTRKKYDAIYGQERRGCPVVSIVVGEDGDRRLVLDPRLLFDPGEETLNQTQTLILNEVASFWKANPQCLIVEGHADKDLSRGRTEQNNVDESLLRAKSVIDHLVKIKGDDGDYLVDKDYLVPKGYGSSRPFDNEDTNTIEGKRRSRRVEFAIVDQSECDRAKKSRPAQR
jgi:outer membrane protein OmpA-like peptidoglycan-associated protein